jgi:thiamine biosynthesis lipoprotein ApbE
MALTGRAAVTVVARRGIDSDSLATAACVLEPQQAIAMINSVDGAAALIVRRTETGEQRLESLRWRDVPKR